LLRTVGVGALLEFLVGVKTFNLFFELLLQPVVVLLAMMVAVAETKPELRPTKRLAEFLLGLVGLLLLVLTIRSIVVDRETVDVGLQVRQLALPVWLTLVSLPFLYVLALYAEHQTAFIRMSFGPTRRKPSWRARLAVMIGLRGRLAEVHALAGPAASRIGQERAYRGARTQVRAFRRELEERNAAEREAADRLVRFAGATGVDEHGRQLDRREFKETCSALEWLWICHCGWYRRDDRYRDDLLDKLGDFRRKGLPNPHGIVMHVSKDGQRWYAYRRTVSGWVFAIGAAGPPTDQWRSDRPEPPNEPPGDSKDWTTDRFDHSLNWES
jgi:hypothetical protein